MLKLMKKILTLALLLTLGAGIFEVRAAEPAESEARAAEPFTLDAYYTYPNEIALNYGVGSAQTFVNLFSSIFVAIPSAIAGMELDKVRSTGTIGVSYQRSLGKVVSVGAAFNYIRTFSTSHNKTDAAITSQYTMDWYTLMATARFYWFKKRVVAMYSKIGVGATLTGSSYIKNNGTELEKGDYTFQWVKIPAFQLSGVCVEFGGRFRGFVELGIGMEGILNAGIKYYL